MFSTGIIKEDLEETHKLTGFQISALPVRYLGVPLVTRRLNARDCKPLVEKIASRINCWSTVCFKKFLEIAYSCVQFELNKRPAMGEVEVILELA